MKSILNNLILAINNLAAAINKKNNTYALNPTTTSNPYSTSPNVKITSYYESKKTGVYITKEEYDALKAVYNAVTDKGSHPKHHDHVAREIQIKWPLLDAALKQLVKVHNYKHNPYKDV